MQRDYNTDEHTELEALILACQSHVERLARRYAREFSRVEFDDFVSIGMLGVCNAAPHAMQAATNPMAYLCKAAQNDMLDEINRLRGEHVTSLDAPLTSDSAFSLVDLLSDDILPLLPVATSKRIRALNGALRRLPSRQRNAVRRLHALPGYGSHSGQEAAGTFGLSVHGARSLDYRGRENLRSDARLCKVLGVEVERQIRHMASPLARSRRLGQLLRQQKLARVEVAQ